MEFYDQALSGTAQQSAFAVIILTGALLVLGGVWSRRVTRAVLRVARGR